MMTAWSRASTTKLNRPDVKDMLAQVYRPGRSQEPFRPDYDPGRFPGRCLVFGGLRGFRLGSRGPSGPGAFLRRQGQVQCPERGGQGAGKRRPGACRPAGPAAAIAPVPFSPGRHLCLAAHRRHQPPEPPFRGSPSTSTPGMRLLAETGKRTGPEVEAMRENYPQEIVDLFEARFYLGRQVVAFRSDAF